MTIQPNYNVLPDVGYEGAIADMYPGGVRSGICEPASIGFGKAVIRGTDPKQVKLGAAGEYMGITVRDITLPAANNDAYVQGDNVAVMRKGTIFAKAIDAVTAGDAVYRTPTGTLTNVAGARTAVAGAIVGTGNGAIGTVTITDGAKAIAGGYTLEIIKAATDAGDFVLRRDADQAIVGYGTVAVAFAQSGFSFTLADGSSDFVVGDKIPITVSGGNTKIDGAVWEDTLAQNAIGRVRLN